MFAIWLVFIHMIKEKCSLIKKIKKFMGKILQKDRLIAKI